MEIRTDVTLPYARERVFATYRDRLAELLEFLPNIRKLEVRSRDDRGAGEVHLVNEWMGGGEIPSVARSFLQESMLGWTDHATWKLAAWICEWRTEVHAFPGALACSGANTFVEVSPDETRIEFRGQLTCDSAKIPGVPRLLSKSINAAVEKLFVGKIAENLAGAGEGIGKLLAREGR
jgi:hypothetical protein